MKYFLILLLALLSLTGCDEGGESTSVGIDDYDREPIERCDQDDDGFVSRDEASSCNPQ